MLKFRSVRSRLAFYFLGFVSLVQIVVFVSLDIANQRVAREQLETVLGDGAMAVKRSLESRATQMTSVLRTGVADESLREPASARPALDRLRTRSGAELVFVVADGRVTVDGSTRRGAGSLASRLGSQSPLPAAQMVAIDNEIYQVVALPMAGRPGSMLVAADLLDTRFAEDIAQTTRVETSFVVREPGGVRRISSSSLPMMRSASLGLALSRLGPGSIGVIGLDLYREKFLARIEPLGAAAGDTDLVLLRSFDKELEAFDDLRSIVLFLSIGGLILSVFGGLFVARSVTDPANALVEAARSVAQGEYPEPVRVQNEDELGTLAKAFDGMVQGLAERDRVRDVLGKVVSPDVAAKILSREVELGGEERVVTILFSDLREFSFIGGPYAPRETVDLLNAYLTRMTAVIERHGGMVDKYLGSGIMAIFGAPVAVADDAGSAMAAALAMQSDLDAFNDELARNNLPALEMGIGVHTASVLAGNIGGPDRRSYTVIGDGVEYAARLEGLSARGRISGRVIASSETVRRSKRPYSVRPLVAMGGQGASDADLLYVVLGEQAPPVAASAAA